MASDLLEILPFFHPVQLDILEPGAVYAANQIGSMVSLISAHHPPDSERKQEIVLLGVCDGRGSWINEGCENAPDMVRRYFYKLFADRNQLKISDLGNIQKGHQIEDTWFVLSKAVNALIRTGKIPVVIGGGQELTYAIYKAYEQLEQVVNLVTIDPTFDLGNVNQENESDSFLGRIILHQPNFLFNYSNLGYQTYLVDPEGIALMGKLFFDAYRLGWVRDNMEQVEPIVRNADVVSLDISCVRYGEAPGNTNAGPNGFYGEEICQIARYAGLSDKLSCFGLFEVNPEFDIRGQTAQLAAQILWCFCEGVLNRKNDFPHPNSEGHIKYRVFLPESKHEIIFYKSKKSDRWWMAVPFPASKRSRYERHHLVPCHYLDYQLACDAGMPDRWWQTFQKLV
jgi:formiminoglutamase